MSAIHADNRLIWLVVGTSLAALWVFALSERSDLSEFVGVWQKAVALSSIGWLILSFFLLRRKQWARWIAVALFAFMGILLLAWPLGNFLDTVAMGQPHWDVNFLAGLLFVVDAVLLVFPDSAGDFFAGLVGADWTPTIGGGLTVRSIRSFQPDVLLESLPQREIMGRRARRITAIAIALTLMVCVGVIGWKVHQRALSSQRWQRELEAAGEKVDEDDPTADAWAIDSLAKGIDNTERAIDIVEFLVLGYLAFFVFPFLLTMPFVLPFALTWRAPVRFLILRPFNKGHITRVLARFLLDEFAGFGHCYTLSDRNVRVPLHVRIPFFLGQLSLFNFRLRKIRHPQHVEKVARGMQRRVRRNINWCFSGTKLFPISCCNPGWRACVARLVNEVDIIVADLSSLGEGIVWELELLRDTGALTRTVFIVEESQATSALEGIAKVVGPSRTIPVLPYGVGVASTQCVARAIIDVLRSAATSEGASCYQSPRG